MMNELIIPVLILGGLGLLFGLGLAFASKKFEVKVDERIEKARELLPGANCGACGYTGCDGFAENVVSGAAPVNGCPVGGADTAARLGELLGKEAGTIDKMVARVMCGGTASSCALKFTYSGIKDCAAAAALHGGPSACAYGCAGMGNCVSACPFGAIVIEDGLARVLEYKCTACGKCVEACPKKIIKMVPASSEYNVACSSLDKGVVVRKICSAGCIGCGKCAKVCSSKAISMKGTLAEINPTLCINCGECMAQCPTRSIKRLRKLACDNKVVS